MVFTRKSIELCCKSGWKGRVGESILVCQWFNKPRAGRPERLALICVTGSVNNALRIFSRALDFEVGRMLYLTGLRLLLNPTYVWPASQS